MNNSPFLIIGRKKVNSPSVNSKLEKSEVQLKLSQTSDLTRNKLLSE